jgi:hypothetical protein
MCYTTKISNRFEARENFDNKADNSGASESTKEIIKKIQKKGAQVNAVNAA